ncbi:MAG: hypothetical protein DMF74_21060 [Acidobacteria bacterium]|nr:MAG: hypothetical protein DMF74_21060 [Acidobacteriota bacterium]
MARRKWHAILTANTVFCLLVMFYLPGLAQTPASAPAAPPGPGLCKDDASPGVIQLTPDPANVNKLALARKHFYLSASPFNLATSVNLKTAPSLRSYYEGAGASQQLIAWLEDNHCETIYCRELTADEVKCAGSDPNKCVREFTTAYNNALIKLNGNQELARKWITNYAPLSSPNLRVGFYEARTTWLNVALQALERKLENGSRIQTTISDKDGIAFFYDLCPGTYYISTIAPINNAGVDVFWETAKPIKVEGPPEVNKATVVTLAFPPGKDKKNFFVGKLVADISQ